MQELASYASLKARASALAHLTHRHYFVKPADSEMDYVLYELLTNNAHNEIVTGTRHEIACALNALLFFVRDTMPTVAVAAQ